MSLVYITEDTEFKSKFNKALYKIGVSNKSNLKTRLSKLQNAENTKLLWVGNGLDTRDEDVLRNSLAKIINGFFPFDGWKKMSNRTKYLSDDIVTFLEEKYRAPADNASYDDWWGGLTEYIIGDPCPLVHFIPDGPCDSYQLSWETQIGAIIKKDVFGREKYSIRWVQWPCFDVEEDEWLWRDNFCILQNESNAFSFRDWIDKKRKTVVSY